MDSILEQQMTGFRGLLTNAQLVFPSWEYAQTAQ
jgi:hypothetical protein